MAGNTIHENAVVNTYVNGKQAEQTLNNLTQSANKYKQAMLAAEKSGDVKAYKKAEQSLKATNKQIRQLKKDQLEVNDLVKNMDDASYNDLYKSTKKLEREFKKLKKSHPDYQARKAELKKYNTELTNQRKAMRGVTTSGQKMSGVFSSIGGSIKALLPALGLGTAIAGIMRLSQMQDELVKTRREIHRLTGLSGQDLDNVTVSVRSLAKTFNTDYKEILEAANAVANQFDISQEEALQKIEMGYLAGADASGEFLDQLKEYPTHFHEAGLSADDLFSVITQSVKEGVYSDKGADAIKEATLRIREMTPATQEAMDNIGISSQEVMAGLRNGSLSIMDVIRDVSARLGELPEQSTEVGTAIADIFGGPGEDAGLKFLTTIKDIGGEFSDMIDKTDPVYQQQEALLNSTKELEKAFNQTFGSATSWVGVLKVKFNNLLTYFLKALKTVRQIKQEVADNQLQQVLSDDKKEIDENADAFLSAIETMVQAQEKRLKSGVKNIEQLRLEKDVYGEVRSAAIYLSDDEKAALEENIELNKQRLIEARSYLNMLELQTKVVDDANGGIPISIILDKDNLEKMAKEAVAFAEKVMMSGDDDDEPLLAENQLDLDTEDPRIEKVKTNAMYELELWQQSYDGRKAALDEMLSNGVIAEKEHADKVMELRKEQTEQQVALVQSVAGSIGAAFGEMLGDQEVSVKEFMKNMLLMAVDYLRMYAIEKIAEATITSLAQPDSVATFGASGLARAAIITGLIEASTATVKAVVSQFSRGKYPVVGPDDGKTYNADKVNSIKTGIYSSPTVGLFNENPRQPEMVVDGVKTKRLRYQFPSTYRWILSGMTTKPPTQYATGKYPVAAEAASNSNEGTTELMREFNKLQKMNIMMMQSLEASTKAAKDSFDRGVNMSLYGKNGLYNAESLDDQITQNAEM